MVVLNPNVIYVYRQYFNLRRINAYSLTNIFMWDQSITYVCRVESLMAILRLNHPWQASSAISSFSFLKVEWDLEGI